MGSSRGRRFAARGSSVDGIYATIGHCRCYVLPPRCYKRLPPLLHSTSTAATSDPCMCYIRQPALLHPSTGIATSVRGHCYRRPSALLHPAGASTTSGSWQLHLSTDAATRDCRRRCYLRPPPLLHEAAGAASAATGDRCRHCYKGLPPTSTVLQETAVAIARRRQRYYWRPPPVLL
jgi:hypothetical protein